ncbi:MAG: hypothetical protein AB7O96_07365 [Pseudobdellovibrionaceae bacterium]
MLKNLFFAATMSLGIGTHSLAAEVTDSDEMWHNMRQEGRFAYEWFYFDTHNPDGSSIVIAFLGPNPYDVSTSTLIKPSGIKNHVGVLVQVVTAEGKRLQVLDYSRNNDIEFSSAPFKLRIGNSVLNMKKMPNQLPEYFIELDAIDKDTGIRIKANITMEALMKGWKHKEGYVYTDGKDYHKWFVTVPKGEVSGSYEFVSTKGHLLYRNLMNKSSGYHDHNYGTLPISDTTDGWYWGRAEVGDKTIIYTQVWGKSGPAFLGDMTYRKNPPSTMFYMATENEILVDSDEMVLNDFGPNNKVELSNGMIVPKNYQMKVIGLDTEQYVVDVIPNKTLAVAVPYYSRQAGTISVCQQKNSVELSDSICEQSDVLIAEQIDYPRFLQIELGLPKPW